jgi:hypothetical protein
MERLFVAMKLSTWVPLGFWSLLPQRSEWALLSEPISR